MSPVIDVHTHCLTDEWFALLQRHGGPRYSVQPVSGGVRAIYLAGARLRRPVPAVWWSLPRCGVMPPAAASPRRRAVHDAGAGDVRLRPAAEDDGRAPRPHRHRVAHVPELLLG